MFKDSIIDIAIKKQIPIIFIERELKDINSSLLQLKLPIISNEDHDKFKRILELENKDLNIHVIQFSDLFNSDKEISMSTIKCIWNACFPKIKFNYKRAELLKSLEIQPLFNSLVPDTSVFLKTIQSLNSEIMKL